MMPKVSTVPVTQAAAKYSPAAEEQAAAWIQEPHSLFHTLCACDAQCRCVGSEWLLTRDPDTQPASAILLSPLNILHAVNSSPGTGPSEGRLLE